MRSRLKSLGSELDQAARDLYASYGYGAAALAGPTSQTLPPLIYASVRRGVTPAIHALSTLSSQGKLLSVVWVLTHADCRGTTQPAPTGLGRLAAL